MTRLSPMSGASRRAGASRGAAPPRGAPIRALAPPHAPARRGRAGLRPLGLLAGIAAVGIALGASAAPDARGPQRADAAGADPATDRGDVEAPAERDASEASDAGPEASDGESIPTISAPEPLPERNPGQDVNRLLRTELSILERVEQLERDMARHRTQLERLRRQEQSVRQRLAEAEARTDELGEQLERTERRLRDRLRAMAHLQRTKGYQVLFASETWSDYLRRRRALDALVEADRERLTRYRDERRRWRRLRERLAKRQRNLANTRARIEQTLTELRRDRREKQALAKAVHERAAFHAKLERERQQIDQELREKVQALRNEDRERLWFRAHRGRLREPIANGRVVRGFGRRQHPEFQTETVHRGLDLRPPKDADRPVEVRTIYWGYVAWTGRMRGLGRTVIVDHTRGYMTLYAHLARIDVEEGDKLETGDQIGIMGATGSLRGPHLYMELRKDGRAIDPTPWFR